MPTQYIDRDPIKDSEGNIVGYTEGTTRTIPDDPSRRTVIGASGVVYKSRRSRGSRGQTVIEGKKDSEVLAEFSRSDRVKAQERYEAEVKQFEAEKKAELDARSDQQKYEAIMQSVRERTPKVQAYKDLRRERREKAVERRLRSEGYTKRVTVGRPDFKSKETTIEFLPPDRSPPKVYQSAKDAGLSTPNKSAGVISSFKRGFTFSDTSARDPRTYSGGEATAYAGGLVSGIASFSPFAVGGVGGRVAQVIDKSSKASKVVKLVGRASVSPVGRVVTKGVEYSYIGGRAVEFGGAVKREGVVGAGRVGVSVTRDVILFGGLNKVFGKQLKKGAEEGLIKQQTKQKESLILGEFEKALSSNVVEGSGGSFSAKLDRSLLFKTRRNLRKEEIKISEKELKSFLSKKLQGGYFPERVSSQIIQPLGKKGSYSVGRRSMVRSKQQSSQTVRSSRSRSGSKGIQSKKIGSAFAKQGRFYRKEGRGVSNYNPYALVEFKPSKPTLVKGYKSGRHERSELKNLDALNIVRGRISGERGVAKASQQLSGKELRIAESGLTRQLRSGKISAKEWAKERRLLNENFGFGSIAKNQHLTLTESKLLTDLGGRKTVVHSSVSSKPFSVVKPSKSVKSIKPVKVKVVVGGGQEVRAVLKKPDLVVRSSTVAELGEPVLEGSRFAGGKFAFKNNYFVTSKPPVLVTGNVVDVPKVSYGASEPVVAFKDSSVGVSKPKVPVFAEVNAFLIPASEFEVAKDIKIGLESSVLVDSSSKIDTRIASLVDSRSRIASKIKYDSKLLPKVSSKIKYDSGLVPVSTVKQQKQPSKTRPTFDKGGRRTKPLSSVPKPPKFSIPRIPMSNIPDFPNQQSVSRGQGYKVFIKRFGKFESANNKVYDRESAKRLGRFKVGTSASATFKLLESSGTPINYGGASYSPKSFYEKEDDVFIEKRGKRIKSKGELREITYKGILANKKNIKGGNKWSVL